MRPSSERRLFSAGDERRGSDSSKEGGSGPTADQLRSAIDREQGRDKVAYPDHAAAPLGTDAEAAGFPPTRHEVATAERAERRAEVPARGGRGMVVGLCAVVLAVILLGFIVLAAG